MDLIHERLEKLKKQGFDVLCDLEESGSEVVKTEKRKVTVTTWKDRLSGEEVRVVVQAYTHGMLGVGVMRAEGFVMNRSGDVFDLSREALYDFT